MKKKIVAAFLCLVMVFSLIPSSVLANDNPTQGEGNSKKNININYLNEEGTEYTYEENGVSYKVIETFEQVNDSKTVVKSEILEKDESGKFIKNSDKVTTVDKNSNSLVLETKKNGKTTIENEKLNQYNDSKPIVSENLLKENQLSASGPINPGEPDLTAYRHRTTKYSTSVANLTYGGIITAISSSIGAAVGGYVGAGFGGGLGFIATGVLDMALPKVYFTSRISLKYHHGTIIPAMKRTQTWAYTSSWRTTIIPGGSYPLVEYEYYY
ncbi:hypothetical protein [Saliterribacillus persicus]|uniref:Uncharacterized protein n=1 Tax=Saliterribacillus persicus TaxID=930114 RepID=A0A368X5S2_9BACI|nr:hypothetical protein [Saliterribacillus persicus]RCW63165.1 hypothetical protein DFR57_11941 [Saliterribacillus persicus]